MKWKIIIVDSFFMISKLYWHSNLDNLFSINCWIFFHKLISIFFHKCFVDRGSIIFIEWNFLFRFEAFDLIGSLMNCGVRGFFWNVWIKNYEGFCGLLVDCRQKNGNQRFGPSDFHFPKSPPQNPPSYSKNPKTNILITIMTCFN